MITIVKDKEQIICSRGTYEEQYKQLGYLPASETKEATRKVVSSFKEESEEDKIGAKYGTKRRTTTKKEEE